jgi:2-polyprenyl-3-methyl-5-hydroxy-6-metoxy-1,4-benzoquinol methylase
MNNRLFQKDPLLVLDESPHSPHQIVQNLINKNAPTVLDIGCNAGFFGEQLMEKKNAQVDGIDINEEALEKAKIVYRKIFKRDLYDSKLDIGEEQYDYIIFSDILEHLPRPDLILKDAKKYLKNGGRVIITLPNVARLEIRIGLLLGKFDYAPGILSHDHLRFFTKKSARRMIEECGYEIKKIIPTGFGHRFGILPSLTAFQFIYVCKKNEKNSPENY